MPAIRKAESEVEALREELAARNRAQAVLHHETSEQKATIHALKDELVRGHRVSCIDSQLGWSEWQRVLCRARSQCASLKSKLLVTASVR
jgi:hypothetical protein